MKKLFLLLFIPFVCFGQEDIERYKVYKELGLLEPEKITQQSKEYQKRSDVYLEFIDEYNYRSVPHFTNLN